MHTRLVFIELFLSNKSVFIFFTSENLLLELLNSPGTATTCVAKRTHSDVIHHAMSHPSPPLLQSNNTNINNSGCCERSLDFKTVLEMSFPDMFFCSFKTNGATSLISLENFEAHSSVSFEATENLKHV